MVEEIKELQKNYEKIYHDVQDLLKRATKVKENDKDLMRMCVEKKTANG